MIAFILNPAVVGLPILADPADSAGMSTKHRNLVAHPTGEQPEVDLRSAIADTFAGRVHVEWDAAAPVTPLGQLAFFTDYLKQTGLFDAWVADRNVSTTLIHPGLAFRLGSGHILPPFFGPCIGLLVCGTIVRTVAD
jgi:hypothetical protein